MSLEESVIQQQEQQLLYYVSLLLRLQNAVPMLCEESTRALSPECVQTLCKMAETFRSLVEQNLRIVRRLTDNVTRNGTRLRAEKALLQEFQLWTGNDSLF